MSGGAASPLLLRKGERLLLQDTESRVLRGLADGFICVLAIFVGVAFHSFVSGETNARGLGVLVTIAVTLAPFFLFMSTRPLSRVLLTDQRIFVGTDPDDLDVAELHQIADTRVWLATLFIRLRAGTTLSVGNMRALYAIEAELTQRSAQ